MASFLRHLATSLLCAVLALGHAPAWLHVATCEDESCGASARANIAIAHVCGCHSHHHHEHQPADAAESDSDPDPANPHDPDTCTICQSLATPCGFVDALATLPSSEPACERCVLPTLLDEIASLLLLPPSRGPPAFVA